MAEAATREQPKAPAPAAGPKPAPRKPRVGDQIEFWGAGTKYPLVAWVAYAPDDRDGKGRINLGFLGEGGAHGDRQGVPFAEVPTQGCWTFRK